MERACNVAGCQRPIIARGRCTRHYQQLKRDQGVVRKVRRFNVDELPALIAAHRAQWDSAGIEYGLCLCGCGERTRVAEANSRQRSTFAGEPVPYRSGHTTRGRFIVGWDERDKGYDTPCWEWRTEWATGYGGHRKVYRRLRGPVPDGLELDHLCRNTKCVNPDHLEAVPRAENLRRGDGTKLTADQVREIKARAQRMSGSTYGIARIIAADYPQVSVDGIRSILRGRAWRDI